MRQSPVSDRRLLTLVRMLPAVTVQNTLMACEDRNIAVCILYYTQDERDEVLSHVHGRKANRIRDEYVFLKSRNVKAGDHRRITDHIIHRLAGGRTVLPISSYRKPGSG